MRKSNKSPGHIYPEIRDFLLEMKVASGLSVNTLLAYGRDLAMFFSSLGKKPAAITNKDVTEYLGYMLKSGVSPATVARRASVLKNFFQFLDNSRVNPARIIQPRIPRRLPTVLSRKEVQTLLNLPGTETAQGIRDRAILEILYATGARISEICGLLLEDYKPELELIKVTGKGGKSRFIPIGRYSISAVNWYLRRSRPALLHGKDSPHLFITQQGRHFARSGMWKMLRFYMKQVSPRKTVTPHTIRHTCATHLLEGGANIRVIQEILGHASVTTTQIYTHVQPEYLIRQHRQFHPRASLKRQKEEPVAEVPPEEDIDELTRELKDLIRELRGGKDVK